MHRTFTATKEDNIKHFNNQQHAQDRHEINAYVRCFMTTNLLTRLTVQ